nr:expressed protein [Hymenolepis microstoma]
MNDYILDLSMRGTVPSPLQETPGYHQITLHQLFPLCRLPCNLNPILSPLLRRDEDESEELDKIDVLLVEDFDGTNVPPHHLQPKQPLVAPQFLGEQERQRPLL